MLQMVCLLFKSVGVNTIAFILYIFFHDNMTEAIEKEQHLVYMFRLTLRYRSLYDVILMSFLSVFRVKYEVSATNNS